MEKIYKKTRVENGINIHKFYVIIDGKEYSKEWDEYDKFTDEKIKNLNCACINCCKSRKIIEEIKRRKGIKGKLETYNNEEFVKIHDELKDKWEIIEM